MKTEQETRLERKSEWGRRLNMKSEWDDCDRASFFVKGEEIIVLVIYGRSPIKEDDEYITTSRFRIEVPVEEIRDSASDIVSPLIAPDIEFFGEKLRDCWGQFDPLENCRQREFVIDNCEDSTFRREAYAWEYAIREIGKIRNPVEVVNVLPMDDKDDRLVTRHRY